MATIKNDLRIFIPDFFDGLFFEARRKEKAR
jgi:hypothetical protein